ncbi:MAG TPA: hypoxanthine phosphoribosyltransferase [Nitrospiraceae bacterium]|jgi:hypoxanthine phosphoribosyltransferase|nr:hypoxanthine phosphoribosyltransferase [Nitrospiraceae bacterium]
MPSVKPLLTSEQIRDRVTDLADLVSRDYAGKELLAIGILKGAFIFFADLVRLIRVPVTVDFITASSYLKDSSSGKLQIYCDIREKVTDKHVLLIDDIIDTGISLDAIRNRLLSQNPASLRICVLVDKKERRLVEVPVDYIGFEVPDVFIVGYGIDFDNHYRNLPYIAFL